MDSKSVSSIWTALKYTKGSYDKKITFLVLVVQDSNNLCSTEEGLSPFLMSTNVWGIWLHLNSIEANTKHTFLVTLQMAEPYRERAGAIKHTCIYTVWASLFKVLQ